MIISLKEALTTGLVHAGDYFFFWGFSRFSELDGKEFRVDFIDTFQGKKIIIGEDARNILYIPPHLYSNYTISPSIRNKILGVLDEL